MKFNASILFVKDIEKSKIFYKEFLNLEIKDDFGTSLTFNCGLGLWQISKTHPIKQNLTTTGADNRLEIYFETQNIVSLSDKLQKSSITFFQKLHEEPWGQRTLRFFDPDNHLIEIGECVQTFVFNLAKKGLSPFEINAKTGIPTERINELINEKSS